LVVFVAMLLSAHGYKMTWQEKGCMGYSSWISESQFCIWSSYIKT